MLRLRDLMLRSPVFHRNYTGAVPSPTGTDDHNLREYRHYSRRSIGQTEVPWDRCTRGGLRAMTLAVRPSDIVTCAARPSAYWAMDTYAFWLAHLSVERLTFL